MSTSAVVAIALVTASVRLTDPPAATLVALSEAVDVKLGVGAAVAAGVAVGATVGAGEPVGVGPDAGVAIGALGVGEGGTWTARVTENVAADGLLPNFTFHPWA